MIFEILKNPIYTYLFILTLVIFLVIFIWRKLTILESNFYILEKRVNLMKESSGNNHMVGGKEKVATEIFSNMTDKKLERSNIVMNEIFGNMSRKCNKEDVKITFDTVEDDIADITDEIVEEIVEDFPSIPITYDTKDENCEFENTSNASEFIFNADEKYTQKKLSKLNMDKLKTICEKMNISTDGNKSQLIARILE